MGFPIFLFRFIGAVLIFSAFCMFGGFAAHKREQRPREIRALIRGLELLRTEVGYGLVRLGPALESISSVLRSGDSPFVADFFAEAASGLKDLPAQAAWENALDLLKVGGCLCDGELVVLSALGDSLGRSGSEDQARRLDHAITNLRGFQEDAQDEASRLGRVYRSAWSAIGGCIALLIL